ncbi:Ger(x)C family spore germination protein [Cohnella phaseoli]|nr:Ger(x)C family spore germination protein [Cohnella phaseoli]
MAKERTPTEMQNFLKNIKLICTILSLGIISGCWDIKEIENINYVTTIGIDYIDDSFVLYAQLLDFTAIAKTESGKTDKTPQVWIGKAKAKTLNLAMNDLYASSQERTSWSHVSSIIIGENALKANVLKVDDLIGRFWEIRLTPWVFGTREPIQRLLTVPAFFNFSQRNTLAQEPIEAFDQRSLIEPVRYFQFLSRLWEPGTNILLPSLSINSTTWKKDEKEDSKMFIDGAYIIDEGKLLGKLDNQKLLGVRWIDKSTIRSPIVISHQGEDAAVLSLESPEVHMSISVINGLPKYHFHIKLNGNVIETLQKVSKRKMESTAEEVVRNEVMNTFQNGLTIKSDIYSLEHLLFRRKTAIWKELKRSNEPVVNADSISAIMVKVNINHAGMKIYPLK